VLNQLKNYSDYFVSTFRNHILYYLWPLFKGEGSVSKYFAELKDNFARNPTFTSWVALLSLTMALMVEDTD
jgi:hypothetical protein